MSVRRKFLGGGNVNIFIILFRLLKMQCTWTFTKCFTHSTPQRKWPMLRQKSQRLRFAGAAVHRFHSCFFSHSMKLRGLPLSAVTVLLHYLPRCLRSTVTCGKNTCYRKLKWTTKDALLCVCDTIKINNRTVASQVSQLDSADKEAQLSELQVHQCITPEEWNWHLCSVSAIPANKLIARMKSIDRNQALDFRFSRDFWFLDPISRGQMPVFPFCGRLWVPW